MIIFPRFGCKCHLTAVTRPFIRIGNTAMHFNVVSTRIIELQNLFKVKYRKTPVSLRVGQPNCSRILERTERETKKDLGPDTERGPRKTYRTCKRCLRSTWHGIAGSGWQLFETQSMPRMLNHLVLSKYRHKYKQKSTYIQEINGSPWGLSPVCTLAMSV